MTESPSPRGKRAGREASRRPELEKELTEHYGVSWSFTTQVSPATFDTDASLHNQARFEQLDPKTVETYKTAVERGDIFPAVVAYRNSSGRLVVIDGNHRLAAHRAANATLDVYDVDPATDKRLLAVMTFSLNTKHGKPTSEAERAYHAQYLVDNGATIEGAAEAVNLPARIVRAHVLNSSADRRASSVGIPAPQWEGLSPSIRKRLVTIATDEAFEEAVRLSLAARLTLDQVKEMVAGINGSRSAKRQVEMIQAYRDKWNEQLQAQAGGALNGAKTKTMNPKARIGMALGQLLTIPGGDLDQFATAYAPTERAEAAARMRQAGERLLSLAGALDAETS